MTKLAPATEQYQHFLNNLRESFWGDVYGTTRLAWKKFWEADSERQRDRFAVVDAYERNDEQRRDYRNGYYERDFVTVLGTIRLRIARTRGPEFFTGRLGAISATSTRGINADPGGLFARHQHAASGSGGSHHDG